MKKIICLMLIVVLGATLVLTGCGGGGDTIKIGSKNFTESIVLSEVLAQLIENKTDLNVKRSQNMGGTFICFEAIKSGEIDIYPEYTGTALTALLEMPVVNDPDEVYQTVQDEFNSQFDISWLGSFGLNNTYTLITSKEAADEYQLKNATDLIDVAGDLVFAANHEFFNRDDGFQGFSDFYGMQFKGEPVKMDITLLFPTVANREVDIIIDQATSGLIQKHDLVVLEDDKNYFPPYYAAPIVRNETLEKHPELKEVLNLLEGEIDDAAMTSLNYQVDVEQKEVSAVVTEFLKEKGIIS